MNQKVFSNWIYESSGQLSIYSKQNALFNYKNAIKLARGGVALFLTSFLLCANLNAQEICEPVTPAWQQSCYYDGWGQISGQVLCINYTESEITNVSTINTSGYLDFAITGTLIVNVDFAFPSNSRILMNG